MIIKQIIISAFGGIKDLTIDLSKGMNIIYGKNETGKSTTQAFIKAMFYGLNSRAQAIRENDRKRYKPWDADQMRGQLTYLDDNDIEYLVKRSFASTKKNDTSIVMNAISGIEAKNINNYEPGIDIFGLGGEAFEKTMFIEQLGSKICKDNEDEIMTRLSNLSQSGDEKTSFQKSKEALNQAKKDIENTRRNGKLDVQRQRLSVLTQERSEVLKIYDDIINDQIELKLSQEERNKTKSELENLEKAKHASQKMKLQNEYTELENYMEVINKSTKKASDLEQTLNIDGKIIDQNFIDNLKQRYGEYIIYKRNNIEMEEQLKADIESLQKLNNKKNEYTGFEKLDENIEQKILNYQNDIKSADRSSMELTVLKAELLQSEEKLADEKKILGDLISYEAVNEETKQKINTNEEKIRDLELKWDSDSKKDNIKLRFEILKDKKTSAMIVAGIGILLSFIALILGFAIGPTFFSIFVIGMPCFIYGLYNMNRSNKRLIEVSLEMAELGDIEGIQKEITSLRDELENIYGDYNVRSFREFNRNFNRYYESKTGLDIIKALMKDKSKKIVDKENSIDSEDINRKREFVDTTFSLCDCKGLEVLTSKLKFYEKFKLDIFNLDEDIEKENKKMEENKQKQHETAERILLVLKKSSIKILTMESVSVNIELLAASLAEYKDLENKINATKNLYNSVLRGRCFEEISKQLEGYQPDDKHEYILSVEEIDKRMKEKNSDLITCENEINKFNNFINTKLNGQRTVDQVEVDLEDANEKAAYYKHALKSIEFALTSLEDSFEEIRKNFGPQLNTKVGEILSKITVGKYKNIKITENYDMKIEDDDLNMIKELDYFSNGTWDQIYFALRLGIIDLIEGDRLSMPIILDETFVQYDEERLAAVIDYLYDISLKRQVILFTCQKRELEMVQKYSDINMLKI